MVEAEEKSTEALIASLTAGTFYASNGPELAAIEVWQGERLRIRTKGPSIIEFIVDGEVVERVDGDEGIWTLGNAQCLRARIRDESGTAWTQPLMAN